MILLSFITLIGCLILLIIGAWCVSEGGDILGEKYDATIVGGFIIAWLNTAPETIFFITALESGNVEVAVGAISGSVIVVCTIAIGLCIIVGSMNRKSRSIYLFHDVRQQALILGGSLIILIIGLFVGFQKYLGYLGIITYALFIIHTLTAASSSNLEEKQDDKVEENEEEPNILKGVGFLVIGGILIYLFSEPFINSVVEIGKWFHINPIALAFFFAPIASEAPEILEAISLSRNGKTQNINISFSNLVSGTISKTTLLFGLLCLYSVNRGFVWLSPAYTISMLLVLLCAASAASLGLKSEHSTRSGYALLTVFLFCVFTQFSFALTN